MIEQEKSANRNVHDRGVESAALANSAPDRPAKRRYWVFFRRENAVNKATSASSSKPTVNVSSLPVVARLPISGDKATSRKETAAASQLPPSTRTSNPLATVTISAPSNERRRKLIGEMPNSLNASTPSLKPTGP